MVFAEAFANGFVLEKRTQFEGVLEGLKRVFAGNCRETTFTTMTSAAAEAMADKLKGVKAKRNLVCPARGFRV